MSAETQKFSVQKHPISSPRCLLLFRSYVGYNFNSPISSDFQVESCGERRPRCLPLRGISKRVAFESWAVAPGLIDNKPNNCVSALSSSSVSRSWTRCRKSRSCPKAILCSDGLCHTIYCCKVSCYLPISWYVIHSRKLIMISLSIMTLSRYSLSPFPLSLLMLALCF